MAKALVGKSFKALTYLHLPIIEKNYAPGDTVDAEDLEAAGQTEDMIEEMVKYGTLGDEDADIHPAHIIPDPAMPTIASVVADAKRLREEMKRQGEEIPPELDAVANLDYNQVQADDEGKSGDSNA